jgi:Uma2 family endonuclease
MRTSAPVVVYETKPATEWLLGGAVQKVSPKYAHSVLQGGLYARLRLWARGRGRAGIEWRFWLQPPGEQPRYLVPDVAYLSYDRLSRDARAEAEEPRVAPDVACEILSPDDRPRYVAHKIDIYLRSGTQLVVIVDPALRLIRAIDCDGERVHGETDSFEHVALPQFVLDAAEFFAELDT